MISIPTEALDSNVTTIEPTDLKTYPEWQQWMIDFVEELLPHRRTKVLEFTRELELDGVSLSTIKSYFLAIGRLRVSEERPYEDLSREDLIRWKQKVLPSMVSEKTGRAFHHNTVQVTLRLCRRFLRSHGPYPELLKCLSYENPTTDVQKIRRNLPTVEETRAILEHCGSNKYLALFSLTVEVGGRDSDTLSMRVGDVEFDQHGAWVSLHGKINGGKTVPRRVRVYQSAPALQRWIEEHPYKNDPEAPLWLSRNTDKGRPRALSKTQVGDTLKEIVARAGVKNKRIYPNLLRHAATANWAKRGANEHLLNRIFGWSDKGKTAAIYLAGFGNVEVGEAQLKLLGVATEEQKREDEALRPKECPRCKRINPATDRFCGNCSFPLNSETALLLHQSEQKADRIQEIIVRHIRQKAPELLREALQQPEVQQHLKEMGLGGG